MKFIDDQVFENIGIEDLFSEKAAYENCTFKNCQLPKSDFSGLAFTSCVFDNCDLSLVNLTNTQLSEVRFDACKLVGVHFDNCNPFLFSVWFRGCNLDFSSFYSLKMKNSKFSKCSLKEVDFSESDLSGLALEECDFLGAVFEYTNLNKSDLSSSYNYSIHPETNKIKKAKFSKEGISGLLDRYDIVIE